MRMEAEGGKGMQDENAIVLEFDLTEVLWRRFFQAHYAHQTFFRLRFVYGALLVVIGAFMLGAAAANNWVGTAFLISGLYCVLSRQLFILKSMASAHKGPLFEGRVQARLTRAGLTVTAGGQHSERAWKDFHGYRSVEPGLMLYTDQNAFFFIPREALTPATDGILQQFLRHSEVRRL
ncbi:YcxB family protein [Geoalkalibacter halelectricus]|uniref:YcxB family protein n=1 Tax=Geoalkalibacter halelectricus TaxID=2847045 RepID=A0ABY5ZTX2_9BACT|nr:YcxB family protein [Geoalkalibacter halelectricus]MDO3376884.1 YcxB family protein [Geoalkalibacter halelectricus]UWZ81109.1 YcxB family protein [Geoalkalibacter halelectricus]